MNTEKTIRLTSKNHAIAFFAPDAEKAILLDTGTSFILKTGVEDIECLASVKEGKLCYVFNAPNRLIVDSLPLSFITTPMVLNQLSTLILLKLGMYCKLSLKNIKKPELEKVF